MRSYLSLPVISARVNQKKSLLTVFVTALAVFLVTVIFSLADMFVLANRISQINAYGDWHAGFYELSPGQEAEIAARAEVEKAGAYCVIWGNKGYKIEGKDCYIAGLEEGWETNFNMKVLQGRLPRGSREAALMETTARLTGLMPGDQAVVRGPDGKEYVVTVSGVVSDTVSMLVKDGYALFMTVEGIGETFPAESFSRTLFVKFHMWSDFQKNIDQISRLYGLSEKEVAQNSYFLAALGQNDDSSFQMLYLTAVLLFFLVLLAGVFMITGSFACRVSERMQFYGLLRCLGASGLQVKRYVRMESLLYCRSAIPAGVLSGMAVTWFLCGMLKAVSPTYFETMPRFGISWVGVSAGIVMGFLSVMIASRSPARKASLAEPVSAVSGGLDAGAALGKEKRIRRSGRRVEVVLGIHHAVSRKKTYLLVVLSMAFSIILFLCFTPMVDFWHQALRPLKPWSPDVTVSGQDFSVKIPLETADQIAGQPAVKKAYGRMYLDDIPAVWGGESGTISLISYEDTQFEWAEEYLEDGNIEAVRSGGGALAIRGNGSAVSCRDLVELNLPDGIRQLTVGGVLWDSPFDLESAGSILIVSEETFHRLTGETGYALLDLQLEKNASQKEVDALRALSQDFQFQDFRASNQEVRAMDATFKLFVYGFLVIIAVIAWINVINSVQMSVTYRMKQYGIMQAVGMENRQLVRMVAAESFAYAGSGCLLGCILGIPLHWAAFHGMVTAFWSQQTWQPPFGTLLFCVGLTFLAAALAVHISLRRMRQMDVVELVQNAM